MQPERVGSQQKASVEQTENRGPLRGVRVLDISNVIAGPFAASLLADFGAEVIKIEHPQEGDSCRAMAPFAEGDSLRYLALNRNKKGITLNLQQPEGAALLRRLCANADVLIENFRPGTLERWGLAPEDLRKVNPGLIVVRISGYGQTGPDAPKAGFGTPATAFAGRTYLMGYPDRPPFNPPIALADLLSGMFGAMATLLALYHRDNTGGTGQVADVSLYESVLRLLESMVAEYSVTGRIAERQGGSPGSSSPSGTYRTADGRWAVLVCSTDRTFNRLAAAMGHSYMREDPRYRTNAQRVGHRAEVDAIVQDWVGARTWDEVRRTLDQAGCPVCLVHSVADIFTNPQYQERESIVTVDHPRLGKLAMPNVTPRLSETPGRVLKAGPELGQHNSEVYRSLLGLTAADLARLKTQKVI